MYASWLNAIMTSVDTVEVVRTVSTCTFSEQLCYFLIIWQAWVSMLPWISRRSKPVIMELSSHIRRMTEIIIQLLAQLLKEEVISGLSISYSPSSWSEWMSPMNSTFIFVKMPVGGSQLCFKSLRLSSMFLLICNIHFNNTDCLGYSLLI